MKQDIEFYAKHIVDSCYIVHKELGPGLLESVYSNCLVSELTMRNIKTESEVSILLFYRGSRLNKDFRIDILVEGVIIIEVKAVDVLLPVHTAQLISYLKLANKKLGFLINFNVPIIKTGIHRYINGY